MRKRRPFSMLVSTLVPILALSLSISACQDEPQAEQPEEAPIYKTRTLGELSVPVQYSAPATAVSLNTSTLKAEISARIEAIPAQVGDRVATGDVLVKLNCADAKAQQQQARAHVSAARARAELAAQQLQRARSLQKKRSISEEQLSQRQSQDLAAQAELQARQAASLIAANQVKRCRITSPYPAIVSQRMGQVGELASPGTPMLQIVASEGLEISAEIIPTDAPSLEQASEIVFLATQRYPAKLRTLTGVVDSLTRTREARLHFVDKQPLPGTPGRLQWFDRRLGIPSQYLSQRQGQLGVLIAEQGRVAFVALPHAQEGRVAATDLPADTAIITLGRAALAVGDALPADSAADTGADQ